MSGPARVLVIGWQGQLGADLRRCFPAGTLGVDYPECDVRDQRQVEATVAGARPQWVINCAAQTNVDGCEHDPHAAFAVNAVGAWHVARAAARWGARVIYISTDYVFGARPTRDGAFSEDDCPAPLNVYGASKLAGEHLTLACSARNLVVRTSGLYGHAGARGKGGNFVETMLRLAATGQPIRVVNDQRLSPTSTVALATRLAALLSCPTGGIVHVAAPDACSWFEFASEIFAYAQLAVDISAVPSSHYPTIATRPALSALTSRRLADLGIPACPPWRQMLHEYLRTRPVPPLTSAAPQAGADGQRVQR